MLDLFLSKLDFGGDFMSREEEVMVMEILVSAGEARTLMYEALDSAKKGCFHKVDELVEEAEGTLKKAQNMQTSLIKREANGEKIEFSVLFLHCQNHLMNASSEKRLIDELIEMTKKLNKI